MKPKKLWACIVTHCDVAADHLILVRSKKEPSDKKVKNVLVGNGMKRDELEAVSVHSVFDMEHWLMQYDNRDALAAFIADGGMNTPPKPTHQRIPK